MQVCKTIVSHNKEVFDQEVNEHLSKGYSIRSCSSGVIPDSMNWDYFFSAILIKEEEECK